MAFVAVIAAALLLAACNPFARDVSLDGAWTGTYEATSGDDTGVLLLELQVTGSSVSGSWESSLPGSLSAGTVTGAVGPLIMLEMASTTVANCTFQMLAEQDGDRLTGGYMAECGAVPNGWVELSKR